MSFPEIPEGWIVKRLASIGKFSKGGGFSKSDLLEDGFPAFEYVDIGNVSFENGIEKTESYLFKNAPSRARRIANIGDTIISTVRTYLKAIDFINKNKSDYIYSTGFALLNPSINGGDLSNLFTIYPPLPEQKAIVNYIERETAKIDKVISAQEKLIEKLKEYK